MSRERLRADRGNAEIVRTVTAAGRPLRVSVRPGTDEDAPPLLLMNGIGAPLEVLQPFVDALQPRRTVIRFDVPGVGGSPRPLVPYVLATLTPVVAGMLDRLGYDRPVDVLGLSWGGGLAQHFAVQHRRRCRRLVLAATGTGTLMVPGSPAGAGPDAHPAPAPRPRVRAADRRPDLRRHDALGSRAGRPGAARGLAAGPASGATTTSSRRAPAGAACRSCGSSGSPRSSSPGTTTRSCRWRTPGSWAGCCPTPRCTCTGAGTWR